MGQKFYNSWRNKTPLERRYIESLEKAVEWIKGQEFFDSVVAIYVKGSFAFREINKKSDIDLVAIMQKNSQLQRVREIRDKHKDELKPVDILPISLEELAANERFVKTEMKGRPDYDTIFMRYFKFVYGKPPEMSEFKVRPTEKLREALKSGIINKFIPMQERGEFGFGQVMKQVAHLIYWDTRIATGKDFEPSWKALRKACPSHELLGKLYAYRLKPAKDEHARKELMREVKEYLGISGW